jgi:hypothetical protein
LKKAYAFIWRWLGVDVVVLAALDEQLHVFWIQINSLPLALVTRPALLSMYAVMKRLCFLYSPPSKPEYVVAQCRCLDDQRKIMEALVVHEAVESLKAEVHGADAGVKIAVAEQRSLAVVDVDSAPNPVRMSAQALERDE